MEVEEGEISEGRGRNVYFAYIYVCVCFVFLCCVLCLYINGESRQARTPRFQKFWNIDNHRGHYK